MVHSGTLDYNFCCKYVSSPQLVRCCPKVSRLAGHWLFFGPVFQSGTGQIGFQRRIFCSLRNTSDLCAHWLAAKVQDRYEGRRGNFFYFYTNATNSDRCRIPTGFFGKSRENWFTGKKFPRGFPRNNLFFFSDWIPEKSVWYANCNPESGPKSNSTVH